MSTATATLRTLPCTAVEATPPELVVDGVDVTLRWTSDIAATARLRITAPGVDFERAAVSDFGGRSHSATVSALECDTVYEAVTINDTIHLTQQQSRPYEFATGPCEGGLSSTRPLRLMPIGDSITEGDGSTATYRRALWQLLRDAGIDVDFVGTRHGHQWRNRQFANFDQHHVAQAGARSDAIRSMVDVAAPLLRPDIALIHIGTNDVFAGLDPAFTASELRDLVTSLRAATPNVTVLVSPLNGCTGCGIDAARFDETNRALRSTVAELDRDDSPVLFVDTNEYLRLGAHTTDGIHPDEEGDRLLAEAWFNGLLQPLGLED